MHCKNSPCPTQGVNGHFSIRSVAVAPVRGHTPSPLTPPDTVRGRDVNEFATPEERQRIDDLQANRRAESTRDRNRRGWRIFSRWLAARNASADLPVAPELVALFAIEYSDGHAMSSADRTMAGIAARHKDAGFPSPTDAAVVKEVMAGLRRELETYQSQAKPLYAADVEKIVATACNPRPSKRHGASENGYEKSNVAELRGRTDIAIVLVGRDGCMRISEIANLLWGDIRYNEDGSGIAIIRFAKGDQEGAGAAQWLSPRTMQALVAIRPENANPADRIFGLKDRTSIYGRIRKAALAAGLGDGYSGHSLRVGMIYDMVDADIPAPAIIIAARWKTLSMLARYTRYIDAARGAVAQLYADKPRQIKQVIRRRPPIVVRYLGDGLDPYPQNFITAGA